MEETFNIMYFFIRGLGLAILVCRVEITAWMLKQFWPDALSDATNVSLMLSVGVESLDVCGKSPSN